MALNYFELLNVGKEFEVDEAALRRAYMDIQQACHPDKLVGKPDRERAVAIQKSMDANDAYEQLKNPLYRAEHLLLLHGITVNSDGADTVHPNQALLMEVLEMREQINEAVSEADAAKAVRDIREAMDDTIAQITRAFNAADHLIAAQLTIRLRYLVKTLEEAMMLQYRLKDVS